MDSDNVIIDITYTVLYILILLVSVFNGDVCKFWRHCQSRSIIHTNSDNIVNVIIEYVCLLGKGHNQTCLKINFQSDFSLATFPTFKCYCT